MSTDDDAQSNARRARHTAIRAEYADEDAAAAREEIAQARGRGRPSLSGDPEQSPHVVVRVPAQLKKRFEQRAEQEGRPVAELAREAFERYLA